MARLSNRLKAPANREPSGGGSRHAFYDWCNEVLAEADDRQGEAVISFAALRVFTARWILMPLILLPPSKPRPKQVGAELTGSAVDDDGTGFRSIAAGPPLGQDQAVEQPTLHGSSGRTGSRASRTGCRTAGRWRATESRRSTRSPGSPCAAPLRSMAASARSGSAGCHLPPSPRVPPAPRRQRRPGRQKHPTRPEKSWRV